MHTTEGPMFGSLSEMAKTEAEAMFIWEPFLSPPAFRALKSTDFTKAPHEIGKTLFSHQFSKTSNGPAQYIYQAPAGFGFTVTHLSFSVKNLGVSGSDIYFVRGTSAETNQVLHAQHYVAPEWQNVNITYSVPWFSHSLSNGENNDDGLHFIADNNSSVFGVIHGYLVPA